MVTSTENIGQSMAQLYPHLRNFTQVVCTATDVETLKQKCDAVFMALPHGLSVPLVQELSGAGVRCVDLGADFRLKDSRIYEQYYEMVHPAPEMLATAVYGIPELYREEIRGAQIVANPGCFPTLSLIHISEP